MNRLHIEILLSIGLLTGSVFGADVEVFAPKSIEPFFAKHCYACHDTETAKADLDLEKLSRQIVDNADALNWQDILDQLNAGEMPPKKKPRPEKEELALVVGDLTASLQSAQKMLRDSGGAIAFRRLNRREYEATIKDLMGLRIDGSKLPDDASGRFDTIGQNQSLSAIQLEKYFSFGQEVARMALHWASQPRSEAKVIRKDGAGGAKSERKIYEILQKVKRVHETGKTYQEVGLTQDEWITHNWGSEKYPRHAEWRGRKSMADYYIDNVDYHGKGRMLPIRNLVRSIGVNFPHDARAHYHLRACAGVVDGVKQRRVIRMTVPFPGTGLNAGNGKPIGSFFVTGSIDEPSTHEMVWYPVFTTDFMPQAVNEARRNVTFLEDQRGGPGTAQLYHHYRPIEPDAPPETLLVRWLEAEGPFYDPPTLFEQLVDTHQLATATDEELDPIAAPFLRAFADGAFRGREVPDAWLEKLKDYYAAKRAGGEGFREAMVDPLAMILTAPRFLYLVEPEQEAGGEGDGLDAISLANRLSHFLWSAPPDEALLALAREGTLPKPEVIDQQVERMLDSPKAENFFSGFMGQWMHLARFDEVGLCSRLLVFRTDAMIEGARREPVAFFKTLVRENLPASSLIDSDFVVVNGVLAQRYGLQEHYRGDGFRKVQLPPDSPRGGLLTQAAFLSIGTMNNRTSPVIRGSLVKEILLNDPPPPPPPNVPELVHAGTDPLASVRELVALHQTKAQCASCHARFDFIGLGLENFDAVGLWRDEELVTNAQEAHQIPKRPKKIYPVDASGELPNGEKFKDIHGLKAALMKQERAVAASLFEGLLCYGLGRNVSFTDRPIIKQALVELEKDDFPVRAMIKRIVTSDPFLRP